MKKVESSVVIVHLRKRNSAELFCGGKHLHFAVVLIKSASRILGVIVLRICLIGGELLISVLGICLIGGELLIYVLGISLIGDVCLVGYHTDI